MTRPVTGGGGLQSLLERYPRAGRREALRHQVLRVRGRSVAWLPPLLLLLGIATVDANTTGDFRIISWIVLVPGIAAAICGAWGTAAFAVLSLLAYLVVDRAWPDELRAGLPDLILVALGGLLATAACAVRIRGEEHILRIRGVVETIHRTVLRPLPARWGGLDHAAVYLTADADARVGGDFYDIQPGPHGTRVLVGDVQGKGLGAVEAAAALLGTFREAGYHEPDLATVAERMEVRIRRHQDHTAALGRPDSDRFATALLLGFPRDTTGTVDVVNFGHDPPLIAGPRGVRTLPTGGGLPLGLGDLAPPGVPTLPPVRRFPFAVDETLLLTTDGVTEARARDGAFYPLAAEVTRALTTDPRVTKPRRLVAFVRDGVLRHAQGHLEDDTTVFAVRRIQSGVRRPGPG
ncbi:serine/threonine-protein phosphatase [Streptomyces spinoverrucosus]|uniref:PP2C family protein-serine/threonine phosphatase n=1 Tax=Streptomyces spinoverrucosus TaxID=284043 RepID=UPI0018C40AC4|nr:PP2C family protein-serine/threonine phosphatase [Streptomyces spinoverrucosus]MBG0853775.1 serine/threonine-protein phosphatase [Streptomyces spinoverrucosus]